MPNIRQAIAVFAVGAFCIGFNASRYPAVRGMFIDPAASASLEVRSPEKPSGANLAREGFRNHDGVERRRSVDASNNDTAGASAYPDSPLASLNSSPYDDTTPNSRKKSAYEAQTTSSPQDDDKPKDSDNSTDGYRSTDRRKSADNYRSRDDYQSTDSYKPAESDQGTTTTGRSAEDSYKSTPEGTKARSNSTSPPEYKPNEDAYGLGTDASSAAPANPSSSSSYDPATGVTANAYADYPGGRSAGSKTPAKFVSSSGETGGGLSTRQESPPGEHELFPIRRPAARVRVDDMQESMANVPSDTSSGAKPESAASGFRRLPLPDAYSGCDSPEITSELVQTYPVTNAN